jgi:hypothetical protein
MPYAAPLRSDGVEIGREPLSLDAELLASPARFFNRELSC